MLRLQALKNTLLNTGPPSRSLATMATDTASYKFNNTMLRVKDPKASISFYEALGMKQIHKAEIAEFNMDFYSMGYAGPKAASGSNHYTDREGVIELAHRRGAENDPNYKVANGNKDPGKGFGHTCISVDNIQAACKRLEDAGYRFQKRLKDGRMHHIAFALDPDDYWVEIIARNPVDKTEDVTTTDIETYRMNHTMIRVKDIEKSLAFYKDVMGMQQLRKFPNPGAKFDLYFLAYGGMPPAGDGSDVNPSAGREGILELTYNYGTEKEEGQVYHNGNSDPEGFGHIAIAVDNLEAACKRFEEKGVSWEKKLGQGTMADVAFMHDPDGYWIKLIANEGK